MAALLVEPVIHHPSHRSIREQPLRFRRHWRAGPPSSPAECGARHLLRRRDLQLRDLVGVRDLWVAAGRSRRWRRRWHCPTVSAFLDRALQKHVRFPALYRPSCRNIGRRGWDLLLFTWHDLNARPAEVAAEIRATLAAAA
jgi:hypothetical protein